MKANVAVYTFAISVFVAFLLWSSKNLGIIGLLGAFSVGLISYSMDSSIETAVASIVIAGVLIKFILPSIQAKWIEKYADYSAPAIEQQIHSAERTRERIEAMQKGDKTIEGYRGLAPQLLEGFAGFPGQKNVANLPAVTPGNTMATATGNVATPTQSPGAPTVGQTTTTTTPQGGVITTNNTMTTQKIGNSGQTAPVPNVQGNPAQGSDEQRIAQAVTNTSVPSIAYGAPQGQQAPSIAYGAPQGQQAPTMTAPTMTAPSIAYGAQQLPASTFSMSPPPATAPVQPGGTTNVGGLSTNSTSDLTAAATGIVNTAMPGVPNTAAAPATGMGGTGTSMAGFRNIEQFAEQPQAVPGMFKLGELPSESKNGPHIDAGTTIMRALGALNPDQISSLTDDTRKLLDTQKSLMGMLSTMKPMLSDGQNLLASFTNMFGKSN